MNGGELCRAVRSNQTMSHIPFILLTAKTDVNSKIEGMNCGADAFIEKPFSLQYLEACIKNIVDLRKLLRQKFSEMPLMPLNSIAGNSSDEKFLTKMNEIIEQNFSNPELSVDYLAEQLCISRSGLFAKIKSLANITPNELIQARMEDIAGKNVVFRHIFRGKWGVTQIARNNASDSCLNVGLTGCSSISSLCGSGLVKAPGKPLP